jgi:putative glutamine amidotransferase
MRPVVGLLAATEHSDGVPYAAARQRYIQALTGPAGCDVAVLASPIHDPAGYLRRFDALLLGGHQSDVHPSHYGGSPRAGQLFDPDRDESALRLVTAAVAVDLPLLGICRGLQELNVALGGSLRDLGDTHAEDLSLPRDEQYLPRHRVRCTPGGVLRGIAGEPDLLVNSLHHQGIDRLGAPLQVEGVADDGVIEAISLPRARFCLAVQWHPEWYATSDPVAKAIFRALGDAAGSSR